MGIGFEHDLGGGAKLVVGFAQVPHWTVDSLTSVDFAPAWDRPSIYIDDDRRELDSGDSDIDATDADRPILDADRNVASIGLTFKF